MTDRPRRQSASTYSHRQRQNLLAEFTNELGMADMRGKDVSYVLAHRDAPFGCLTPDDFVDDAIGARHYLGAVTLVCAARLGHKA